MKQRARVSAFDVLVALVAGGALLTAGCEATLEGGAGAGTGATSGSAGDGASGTGAGGSDPGAGGTTATGGTGTGGSGVGGSGGGTADCVGTHVTTQKRVVRLSDNQLVNTYATLFGEAATAMFTGEEILAATERSFPPLATVGTSIGQSAWDLRDRAAKRAMTHVASNLTTLTTCGDAPTDSTCGLNAVLSFAEAAYRRPLTPEETASYQTLWAELTSMNGGGIAEAIQFGYDAVLLSPGFLYRTETGGDWSSEGPIDQYEFASELSYFLSDGPPDPELLTAAASGQLTDKSVVRAHALRILGTPAARANLEAALIGYFQLTSVPRVVIDEGTVDGIEVTSGLLNSMYREGEEFIKNTIWQGALADLITSRRTWVNTQIAPIYGVTVQSRDVNVFTEVMLPMDRAGLLTLSPFLTSKSRPDGTSVVGRGLAVNAALVCSQNPAFPEDNQSIADTIASQSGWTEKEKADFRADPTRGVTCFGCHAQFDAMGLVLENYDAVGRYRSTDPAGNPIDAAWTTSNLPEAFDYDQNGDMIPEPTVVSSPLMLAQELLRDRAAWGSNALTRCMAMNLINFALADESQGSARAALPEHPTNSCAVRAVTDAFAAAPDKNFTTLLAEIAASNTLSIRSPGM